MKLLYFTSLLLAITNLALAASCSKKKVVGYFSEWRNSVYPISKVDLSKLTHINYAFATIDPSSYALEYDGNILDSVVSAAHKKGVKVLMSVGGWYGSRYFTKMTSSQSNMEKFAESCKKLVSQHKVDGIDIDWEYPGREGACNTPDLANDTDNYLKLLKILRNKLGSNVLITAAVSVTPFEKNGQPVSDLSEFAKIFDFINIMAYDFAGGWSSVVTHHASLYTPEKGDLLSVSSGVNKWTSSKFPASKIVVGVPAYGKSWIASSSTKNGLYQSVSNGHPKGDRDDSNDPWTNYCGQTESQYSSNWKYKNLRSEILKTNYTTPSSSNWIRKWDDKVKSPYLFNKSTKQFISYDDPNSIKYKAKYVVDKGYAGIMVWELENDTNNFELLTAINKNLGCSGSSSSKSTSGTAANGAAIGAATDNAAGNAAGNATGSRGVNGNGQIPGLTPGQTPGQTGPITNSETLSKPELDEVMKLENSGVVSRCGLLSLYLILYMLYIFW